MENRIYWLYLGEGGRPEKGLAGGAVKG